MLKLVDSHCHLDFPDFDEDRATVFQNARDVGVVAIISIGIDPKSWGRTSDLANAHDQVRPAYGVHPNSVEEFWTTTTRDDLRMQLSDANTIAVGEIGLDYYRGSSDAKLQQDAFEAQLDLARDTRLPVIIHTRSAGNETLEILSQFAPLRGVMHCFSFSLEFATRCLELGLYIGVGGISTFPSAQDVRDALQQVPLDRLIVETDAPFLAPQSHRGKRNEPAFVRDTAERLAALRGITLEEIADQTTSNACALFGDQLSAIVERAGVPR